MRNEKQFKKFISEIAVKIANKDFLLLEEDPKDEEEDMYKDTTKQDRSEKGVMDPMDVVYKGIKHGTPTEKNVMDKSLKNLAQKIEDQSGDSATGIVFGRSNRGQTTTDDGTVSSEGYNATKFVVEFRKRKAFSVSILPNDRIVYDSRSKFVSPDLKKEIDSFLLNYKRKAGIVGSEIRYEGIKLSNSLKKQAADVLSKLSLDIDDTVSLATISTKGAGNKRESITFKVVFDNMPAFLGVVRVDPSNFPKPSSDPDKRERSTSFTPGYTTDKSGNVIKPFSGDPKRMNRYTPVSPGSQGNPKKRFDSLKEVDYAYASKSTRLKEPQIKAGFLTAGGNVIDLSRVDYIEQKTLF